MPAAVTHAWNHYIPTRASAVGCSCPTPRAAPHRRIAATQQDLICPLQTLPLAQNLN
jgi:hypothetical protein